MVQTNIPQFQPKFKRVRGTSGRPKCRHGYTNLYYCLKCFPHHACKCGSGKHKKNCCYPTPSTFAQREYYKIRKETQQAENQKKEHSEPRQASEDSQARQASEGSQPSQPSEPSQPSQPSAASHAATKMMRIIVNGVEMEVETGASLTINGTRVVLGGET